MTATKLTPQPCRFQVDGEWRDGELIKCIEDHDYVVKNYSSAWIVRDSHTGECFELDEAPKLITEPHEEE